MAAGYKTGGRKKGTPNKATNDARQAISLFVEGNIERLQEWLDSIADDDPLKAFDAFMKVVEYHIPKLSRAEHKHGGDPDNPLVTRIERAIVDGNPKNTDG